jgi:hypothetical protein
LQACEQALCCKPDFELARNNLRFAQEMAADTLTRTNTDERVQMIGHDQQQIQIPSRSFMVNARRVD